MRSSAAEALGNMGDVAKDFAPHVAKLLEDPDPLVCSEAAKALGEMGGAAKEFAPQVAKLLEDPDRNARISAAEALHISGPLSNIWSFEGSSALRILILTKSTPAASMLTFCWAKIP